jgi:hypothetical protein
MRNEPTNSDDTIDSRDIIERIEELESDLLPWRAKLCDWAGIDKEEDFATHEEARDALAEWLRDHAENYETREDRQEALEACAADVEALNDGEADERGAIEGDSLTASIQNGRRTMFQQFDTVQDYYRSQARKAAERRVGEDRRKAVAACVAAFMERRTGDDRRGC